jgi:hypothetical protein
VLSGRPKAMTHQPTHMPPLPPYWTPSAPPLSPDRVAALCRPPPTSSTFASCWRWNPTPPCHITPAHAGPPLLHSHGCTRARALPSISFLRRAELKRVDVAAWRFFPARVPLAPTTPHPPPSLLLPSVCAGDQKLPSHHQIS